MSRKSQSRGKASYKKSSKSDRRAQKRRQEKMRSVWMMVGGAFLLVAAVIFISSTIEPPVPRIHPMANENSVGDPNAPIVIVEYSDFQCSSCRDFFTNTEQEIFRKYVEDGTVRFVYRAFGNTGPYSGTAAQAAFCAEDQGMFWEMHDAIFLTYDEPNPNNLKKMAKKIDLDTKLFNDCLDSEKYLERVTKDLEDGIALGITGTPSFEINGRLELVGAHSISSFDAYIESFLAGLNTE